MLNKRLGFFIITAISAFAIVSIFTLYNAENKFGEFSTPDESSLNTFSMNNNKAEYEYVKGPPPMTLDSMYGDVIIDQSNLDPDIKSPNIHQPIVSPIDVLLPSGIELKKTMATGDPEWFADMTTTIYGPKSINYENVTTVDDVLDNHGIIIIQTFEKQYDRDTWLTSFVKQIGDAANLLEQNGNKIVSINGDPQKGTISEIIFHKQRMQIDVISVAYNANDLLKMTSPP